MPEETWLARLHEHGYRLTAARRAIVEIVQHATRSLTPLEIYDMARKKYPALGLVSVYRTLERLEELHLIQRVHHPQGCQAFVTAASGHQHLLLCQQCGQVEFFDGDDLDALTKAVSKRTGYKIKEHWLQLFGLCSACGKD